MMNNILYLSYISIMFVLIPCWMIVFWIYWVKVNQSYLFILTFFIVSFKINLEILSTVWLACMAHSVFVIISVYSLSIVKGFTKTFSSATCFHLFHTFPSQPPLTPLLPDNLASTFIYINIYRYIYIYFIFRYYVSI